MAQEQTSYAGDDVEVVVNVVDSSGTHVSATINTTTTRIHGNSAAPTVTEICTGVYKIVFSGVTPAPAEGDRLIVKVNGVIDSTSEAWSDYGVPVLICADERGTDNANTTTPDNASIAAVKAVTDSLPNGGSLSDIDSVVDAIKAVTDNLPNSGALSDLATAASISALNNFDPATQTVTTDAASRTASQADVSALATAASISALNDFDPATQTVTTDAASRAASQADVSSLATAAAVTTIDSIADSILVIANKLDSAMESDGLVSRFTTNALEQAPSGGGGGDATASNQATIITHLTDIKGSGFASTDTLEAIRDRGDTAWTTGGSGSGIYSLTVTCQDSSGNAVANVRVNIDGTTTTLVTNSSGQCVFNLDAGDYSLVASPPSEFNTPADTSVTISADASQTITLTQASTSGSAGWVG